MPPADDDIRPPCGQQSPLALFEDAAVRLRDRRIFPHTDWEIGPGQHWVITGGNGAGKSSLARALVGRLPIVQGRLSYPGLTDPQRQIGYMSFERRRHLWVRREGLERARYFAKKTERPVTARDGLAATFQDRSMDRRRFRRVLTELGAADLIDRPLGGLSSGELQKLLLALALTPPVRLLVLDEPFDGLDSVSRRRVNRIIAARRHRTQVVLVTQHPADRPDWVTHELVVHDCRIAAAFKRPFATQTADAAVQAGHLPPPVAQDGPEPSPQPAVVVELTDVTVRYGRRTVLDRLSWRVTNGQHWAVLGPNGSGKTTLLSLITGDHPQAYANEIILWGRRRGSGESVRELKQRIGLVSSELHRRYQKAVPVFEVVLSGFFDTVGLYRRPTARQQSTTRRWLRYFGLSDLGRRCFTHLSYGQQRLALIARAVVKSPRLLILDEPCQGLDAPHRRRLLDLLDTLGRRNAAQLLVVTHQRSEMPPCIHRILRLTPLESGGYTGVCENGPVSLPTSAGF